jgi:hypothetical protein
MSWETYRSDDSNPFINTLLDATGVIAATADTNISIAGFVFVNSSVTAQGLASGPSARNENLSAGLEDHPN